ncbi:hypothetical protein, partial [Stenotrophomonas maltophilia]|uniref:hypothetical protein n=1 Tax=Stenotrophomonas maltophilia TaxID=40324 RepID=UPI0019546ED2
PVVNSDVPDLAQGFIQHLLSADVQKLLGEGGYGPVDRSVVLDAAQAAGFPYGEEAMAKLATIDWPVVNERRAVWT